MPDPIIVIWGVMGPLILIGMIGMLYIFYTDKKKQKKRRRQ